MGGRRRHDRRIGGQPGVQDIDVGPIYTAPGCDRPEHRAEIAGLMLALLYGTSWRGPTRMDCGCMVALDPILDHSEVNSRRAG